MRKKWKNLIVKKNKYFSLGNYKTKKKHGTQKIHIDKQLNSVINLWLNFNKTDHFLLNSRGGKMTANGLTKFLQKTFEPTGKKISSSLIRSIYLTEKYGNETALKEKEKDAKEMGHSVNEQQKTYVKKE